MLFHLPDKRPVVLLYGLQILDRVTLRLMRPFQPVNLVLPDPLDQLYAVWPDVSGLRHVAVAVAL